MKTNIQQTTFWNFLQKRKIEIPIIQRDYAQGRIGKEFLREKFLKDIKDSLDKDDRILKLDFVYGSIEDDKLNPLDGQQRLTTLWLLHWYIAFKCGEIENHIETFKHFSYETRISSREFCSKLVEFKSAPKCSTSNIIEVIKEQTWFLAEWEQDPTIQAMLTMLGGTDIKDEHKYDPVDGFEEVFKDCSIEIFKEYWQKLTGENCPIIFYYLDLIDLALSDDLYIKMNARGKALTDFENFKADLVGFYKENEEETPSQTLAHKLDNSWTNIFWKFKSNGNRVDEIYFAFINRYLLNKLIANSALSAESIEKDFLFKYLYGKNGDDNVIKYHGFDLYEKNGNINLTELINSMENILDSFNHTFNSYNDTNSITKHFTPTWEDRSFNFFPVYIEGKTISTLTQSQRVVFHAICCYFENTKKYEETSFKQWMRVIWNIVENAGIDGIPRMIDAIRLVQSLAKFSQNIYEHMKDFKIVSNKTLAEEQMKEEKEKAHQICSNNDSDEKVSEWERKIIEAEGTAFFKGAIRFLFRKDGSYDWNVFENRFEKAKKYFNSKGVNEINKSSVFYLKVLISKFDHFDHFKDTIFDNNKESWKKILLKKELIAPINRFFEINEIEKYDLQNYLTEIPEIDANGKDNSRLIFFQNDLCLSDILSVISPRSYFHWWNHERYSLFPHNTKSQKKIFVLADMRNKILSELESDNTISIDEKNRIENMPYFRGWQIHFTCDGKKYELWKTLKVQNEETMEWIEVKEKVNKLKKLLEYVS